MLAPPAWAGWPTHQPPPGPLAEQCPPLKQCLPMSPLTHHHHPPITHHLHHLPTNWESPIWNVHCSPPNTCHHSPPTTTVSPQWSPTQAQVVPACSPGGGSPTLAGGGGNFHHCHHYHHHYHLPLPSLPLSPSLIWNQLIGGVNNNNGVMSPVGHHHHPISWHNELMEPPTNAWAAVTAWVTHPPPNHWSPTAWEGHPLNGMSPWEINTTHHSPNLPNTQWGITMFGPICFINGMVIRSSSCLELFLNNNVDLELGIIITTHPTQLAGRHL